MLDYFNKNKNYKLEGNDLHIVETLSGAAIFMNSDIFNSLNGFNENLFWMEDIDLCKRLNQNNHLIFYSPTNEIIHFSGKSSEKNYNIKISNQLISKIKYFGIHHSIFETSIVYLSILISILLRLIFIFPIAIFSNSFKKRFIGYFFSLRLILFFDWQHDRFSHKDL